MTKFVGVVEKFENNPEAKMSFKSKQGKLQKELIRGNNTRSNSIKNEVDENRIKAKKKKGKRRYL